MKNSLKRLLSIFLAVVMTIGIAPLSGFVGLELPELFDFSMKANAANYSGTCGDSISWSLDKETGLLEIEGTGAMTNYTYSSNVPWNSYRSFVKNVNIQKGVTSIGKNTFYNCDNLTIITIPNSITSIGDYAFYHCDGLTSVKIPNSVTSIGDSAFSDCRNLTSITIPYSVTNIDDYAFYLCDSLSSITVDSNNKNYSSDGYGVLYNKNKTTLIQYPIGNSRKTFTIPNTVTSIGGCAFHSCGFLASVMIPNSVTSIGGSAFHGCNSLTSITIPYSVTSIGSNTFYSCNSLTSITVDSNNKNYSSDSYGVLYNKNKTSLIQYPIGNNRKTFTIPNSVKRIYSYAFLTCNNLTSVTIQDSVTSIGDFAFYECYSLTSVTIGDNVTSIGNQTFHDCDSLTSVTIGDNVTNIGDQAFCDCDSLTSVTIPNSVTSIEYGAFDCDSLTDVYYTGTEAQWNEISIGRSNTPLTKATIHFLGEEDNDAITASGICGENLTWTLYENGLLEIKGTGAMYDYSYNSNMPWRNYILYIKTVNILKGVTSISGFEGCTNLTSINIPETVTRIENYAFDDCKSLVNVYYTGDIASWCGILFGFYYGNPMFYAKNFYIDNTLVKEIVIPDNVGAINSFAFIGFEGIKSVTIPNSVTSIGSYAFCGCIGLTSINIPDSITNIGEFAFSGCAGLISITIPDNVKNIGQYAFEDCTNLTSITIHGGVTMLNNGMFSDCSNLESIVVPESVTFIGCAVFEHCKKLTSITIYNNVTNIDYYAFVDCTSLGNVYFYGTEAEWKKITIEKYNEPLLNAKIHFLGVEEHTHSHTSEVTKQPTCTEAGVETFTCSCGDTYTKLILAKGHSWSEWIITKEPTPFAEGTQERTCSCCGAKETENIPKSEFDVSVLRLENAAAVSAGNTIVITANKNAEKVSVYPTTKDGETVSIEVSGTPIKVSKNGTFYLTFVEWHKSGNKIETQITIGGELVFNVKFIFPVENGGHTEKPCEDVEPTCTENGQEGGTYCEICGEVVVEPKVKEALGHKAGAGVKENVVDATCTEKGSWDEVTYCTVCGEQLSRETKYIGSALGHKEVTDEAVAPTCTETGLTEGSHCSVCKVVLIEQEEIPALGHDENGEWEPDGDNKEIKKCSRCGDVISARITDGESGISIEYDPDDYNGVVSFVVKKVDEDDDILQLWDMDVDKLEFYDITMMVNNTPFHNVGEVVVRIPLPDGFTPDAAVTKVYYMNGKDAELITGVKIINTSDGQYVEFTTNHFSYYGVVELKGIVNEVSINDFTMNYKSNLLLENAVKIGLKGNPDYEITYSSSDTSVAVVDENGNVTAVGTGEAEITVTVTDEYGNVAEDTCKVTVSYAWWQWLIIIFLFGWIWY